jgi:hypothetical protein
VDLTTKGPPTNPKLGAMGERPEGEEREAAERRLGEDLAIRGEAVEPGTDPLPPGATHEVVEERDGVPTKVRRRRFSAGPGRNPDR